MHNYKTKINKKRKKGNSTPGTLKGSNCHANAEDKSMSKNSRSYKKSGYERFIKKKENVRGYKYKPGDMN